jgi:hypothetical protein
LGVEVNQAVIEALEYRLFPALARWLLQAGVSVQEAIDLLRTAAIAEALKVIPEGVNPDSISLASVRTGLSRRLVRESLAVKKTDAPKPGAGGHRGERVLAGWWHDPDFRDGRGHPRILPITAGNHSFKVLVRRYSGESQHRTILKDLEQVGAVAVLETRDRVQVLRRSYAASGWTEAGQTAMAEQLAEHIETCLHNFKHPEGSQHLLCRRVANALVRAEWAKIILPQIQNQVDAQADNFYDTLTDPQYTADPLDPDAVAISLTQYVHRAPPPSMPARLPSSQKDSEEGARVTDVEKATRNARRSKTRPKRRGR